MGHGYISHTKLNQAVTTTASTSVLVGPIDIRNMDKFSVIYQNNDTAINFIRMSAQVAANPEGTAAYTPPNWVALTTATLEVPSALGATSVAVSSRVDNAWAFIRILGGTSSTAPVGTLQVTVTGFQRF